MRLAAALALALLGATDAAAQQVVNSPAAEAVAVAVYRSPSRSIDDRLDLSWLEGYALITETRTVDLPAGDSELRFEGVAGTILPSSVIIRGLPAMPAEKNYDARLLSAGSLVEAALGQQVHVKRTNRATGKVVESEAIIRSGPNGIILQTAAGFEALQCTGLAEALQYREVPPGLSAKPTLSVRASSPGPARVTLSLSYLAGQFDWTASYLGHLAPDGKTLDLFAWVTLANSNDESFPAASVNTIAGQPHRKQNDDDGGGGTYAPSVNLNCWPAGRTSDPVFPPAPPPPQMYAERDGYYGGADIVVTGSRIRRENLESVSPVTVISALQEDLGDLKLYRIPEPVTVAANAQKQVAMLHQERVHVDKLYTVVIDANGEQQWAGAELMLRSKNNKGKGLGLPLPAGSVALFEEASGKDVLAGETLIGDMAIDEDVELIFGQSPDVLFSQTRLSARRDNDDGQDQSNEIRYAIELTNAKPERATVEVGLRLYDAWTVADSSAKLSFVHGRNTWIASVPANGRAKLSYTLRRPEPRKTTADREKDAD